jgi:hypothetical protein
LQPLQIKEKIIMAYFPSPFAQARQQYDMLAYNIIVNMELPKCSKCSTTEYLVENNICADCFRKAQAEMKAKTTAPCSLCKKQVELRDLDAVSQRCIECLKQ